MIPVSQPFRGASSAGPWFLLNRCRRQQHPLPACLAACPASLVLNTFCSVDLRLQRASWGASAGCNCLDTPWSNLLKIGTHCRDRWRSRRRPTSSFGPAAHCLSPKSSPTLGCPAVKELHNPRPQTQHLLQPLSLRTEYLRVTTQRCATQPTIFHCQAPLTRRYGPPVCN